MSKLIIKQRKLIIKIRHKRKISPLGGHLCYPPHKCKYKKIVKEDGGIWTDLANCHRNCPDKCKRYNYYINLSPEDRLKFLLKHNVDLKHSESSLEYYDKLNKEKLKKQNIPKLKIRSNINAKK